MNFRVFPALIVVIMVGLTVKVGVIWNNISLLNNTGNKVFFIENKKALAQDKTDVPSLGDDESKSQIPDGMLPAYVVDEDDKNDISELSSGEIRLLHDLVRRREELLLIENRLEEREAILRAAEHQLIEKKNGLSIIKGDIETLLSKYDKFLDIENKRLINVYSNMKPKSAGIIFNEMDMDTLMIILRGMKERKIAPILAAMDPVKVRMISKELANNKKQVNLP